MVSLAQPLFLASASQHVCELLAQEVIGCQAKSGSFQKGERNLEFFGTLRRLSNPQTFRTDKKHNSVFVARNSLAQLLRQTISSSNDHHDLCRHHHPSQNRMLSYYLLPSLSLSIAATISALNAPGSNGVLAFSFQSPTHHVPKPWIFHGHARPIRVSPSTSKLHMSSTIEPPPGQPQGYAASGQTSLSQSSMVVSADHAPPSWDFLVVRSLWSKVRDVLYDLSPAATSEKVPSYKRLLLFASTMGLVLVSEPLLSLVDTSVVAWTQGTASVVQLAAMGPATTLMDTLIYMTYFLALGTTNLLSEGLAGSRWKELQETTSNILSVAALVGLGLTGFIWFASPVLLKGMAGASATPELLGYAIQYTRIRALVAPASIMGLVAQSFCMVNLSTRAPVLAVLLASIVNVSGDLMLAKYGVVGAAIATAVATISASSLLLVALKRKLMEWRQNEVEEWRNGQTGGKVLEEEEEPKVALLSSTSPGIEPAAPLQSALEEEPVNQFGSETTVLEVPVMAVEESTTREEPPARVPFLSLPSRKSLWRLASVSGPLCFNMWAKMGCYSALTLAATQFGVVPLAAHNILMRLFFFFGCFADSLGMSAQSFLPSSLYPLDKQSFRATLRRLTLLSAVGALFLGKAATTLLQSAGSLLARDGAMLHIMRNQGPYLAAALILHPIAVLTEGTVIATRDFKNLILTYASTVFVHAFLLTNATSFTAVWKALVGFQVVRMASYRLWRKRDALSTA